MYNVLQAVRSVGLRACSSSSWTTARSKLGQQNVNQFLRRNLTGQNRFNWTNNLDISSLPAGYPNRGQLRNSSLHTVGMIVYSRITPNDVEAVTEHMLKGFYENEPFGLALGLTMDQVEPWFSKFLEKVLKYYEPVSFMAKDSDTDKVVGAIINIIMEDKRPPPPSMKEFLVREKQPVKWQIVQFLEDLEEGVDPVKELKMDASKENKILVCLFVSVLPSYGGQGIAKTLIRESEDDAKKQLQGVTIAMTDVTSQFSYLAFQKLGYNPMKEVKYLNYKDPDGIPIFEGREQRLGVHTHARVMVKKL